MSVDDVVDKVPPPGGQKKFFHNLEFEGKRQSIAAWALEKNIAVPTLYTRIRNGWTTERALTTPEGPSQKMEASASESVPEPTPEAESSPETPLAPIVEARNVYRGAPAEPRSSRGRKAFKTYTFKGETATLGVWAKRLNTTPDVLRCRLNQGWTAERAFTESVHTKLGAVKRPRMPQRISHPDSVPPVEQAPTIPACVSTDFMTALRAKLVRVDEIDEKRAHVSAELAELADWRSALVEEIRELIRSTPASKM